MHQQGIVQSVNTTSAGAFPVQATPVGGTEIQFDDAAAFQEGGGQVSIDGVVLNYISADLDADVISLAQPTTFVIDEDTFVSVEPHSEETYATIAFEDDVFEAEVPHYLKAMLPEGERGIGEGETVLVAESDLGYELVDVVGSRPTLEGTFIENAEEMLLGSQKRLGEALADNEAAILAAQGELSEAQQALADAFSQIEVLPDEAYVEAAKQQAIDAAEVAAQALANAAQTAAEQTAQAALAQAQTDLAAAIASGDAAAIADAEAKIATAKAAAIDAAADDAAAKAVAAQSAAEQAAQAALTQAQTDLQTAIANGDAAAIADAEAKIATAKQEAITAAANDATAKAGEAMQKANAALTAAQSAQATADNAIRTYYSETPPWANGTTQPDDVLGDMWYKDSTGQAYRWNGSEWKVIQDASIGEALAAAQDAQTTADGKITAFYQPNEPLEGDEGDLWFDTDNDSAIHRRTGGQWVALLDPKALADAAEQAAKTAAAADATAKAEQAEADAVAAAAADAQTKANQAKADAEAAAKTYADAVSSGASGDALAAAKTYAEQKAAAAQTAAEQAAALDATAKAEAAEAAAAATAAADATAKANAAQAAAIAAAGADATAKANAAKTYADEQIAKNVNLIDNPSRTGELGRWGSSGATLSMTTRPVEGVEVPAIEALSSGNAQIYSSIAANDYFQVDPTKAYQISLWLEDEKAATATQFYLGINVLTSTNAAATLYPVAVSSGSKGVSTNNFYFYSAPAAGAPIGGMRRYVAYLMPEGTDPALMKNLGLNVSSNAIIGADAAKARVRFLNWANNTTTGPRKVWAAHPTVTEVDPMTVEAIQATRNYADSAASQAETNAKAFATTTADGLAKTFWSTALPGTTQAPQNSTWYRHSGGKIISVFTQTAAGASGSTWSARPITSDAIDNLDVGKLTAASGTVNQLVADTLAAKLANIIQANIGNLTVTGDTHLNSVVAQTIAGDTATFINLAVDQILAGNMQAVWNITAGGKIIAGDPEGARVEMTSTGLSVWVIGYNGLPYEAVALHNGEISFGVTNQDGRRVAGISSEGDVLGVQGSFSDSLTYKGSEVVGQLSDPAGPPGWMDLLPRGVLPGRRASSTTTSYKSSESVYLRWRGTLKRSRLYRVVGNMTIGCDTNTGVPRQRLRMATGGSAVTSSSTLLETWTGHPGYSTTVAHSTRVEDIISVAADTVVEIGSFYIGLNGANARAHDGDLYVEDVGARGIDPGGGDGDAPQTTYTTTWQATASRCYNKAGTAISGKDGKVELWYFGSTVAESAAVLFGGVAHLTDDINENGRTLPQALNGATIHRVQLQITNAMWWNSGIRNVAVNTLSSATLPTSKVIDGYTLVKNVPEGATITVDLDPAWFTNGVNRGITLGDKDGTLNGVQIGPGNFQGPGDPDAPLLIITYSR